MVTAGLQVVILLEIVDDRFGTGDPLEIARGMVTDGQNPFHHLRMNAFRRRVPRA